MTRRSDNFDEWFWESVDKTDTCWNFMRGSVGKSDHRQIIMDGRRVSAHVASWERVNGPVPEGKWLLHSCNHGRCVNPDHLRPGNVLENVADMMKAGNHRNARKTHCDNGHEFTAENTYRPPSRPHTRQCRECIRTRGRKVAA